MLSDLQTEINQRQKMRSKEATGLFKRRAVIRLEVNEQSDAQNKKYYCKNIILLLDNTHEKFKLTISHVAFSCCTLNCSFL